MGRGHRVSFLIVFVCAALLEWLRSGALRRFRDVVPAATGAVVLVMTPQCPTADAGRLDVGWVQGNGPSG